MRLYAEVPTKTLDDGSVTADVPDGVSFGWIKDVGTNWLVIASKSGSFTIPQAIWSGNLADAVTRYGSFPDDALRLPSGADING